MNPSHIAVSRLTAANMAVGLLGICLSSCAATPAADPSVQPAPNPNWVKVRSTPPTWYPRGTPAGCSTDGKSGEWVNAGDDADTRFFIPFHGTSGIPRHTLVSEALAARSERKKQQVIDEDSAEGRDKALIIPLAIAATPLLIPCLPFIYAAKYQKETERASR